MHEKNLKTIIQEHPFLADLPRKYIDDISGHARLQVCHADEYLFHAGHTAECCYLIREGLLAIELYHPSRGPMTVQTVESGQVIGWSWLVEPYKWIFDARAVRLTQGICIDAVWLREHSEVDHEFGYLMLKRFMGVMGNRLEAARVQLMDLYGPTKKK